MALNAAMFLLLAAWIGLSLCSGIQKCREVEKEIKVLEALPGGGWDNIRNLDMGRVMDLSYSLCQTTEDGYLLPDEVFIIPQKESRVEHNSEIIGNWQDYRSTEASSINADVSFKKFLNSKFSIENRRVKTHQVKEQSVTSRLEFRHFLYTIKAHPSFALDPRFKRQVMEIADALENNETRNAEFLSEMLVLEYGTHVVTSLDVGASLVHEDYLKSTFVLDTKVSQKTITFSAQISFLKLFDNISLSWKKVAETTESKMYEGNITYSFTESHGGVPFYPGLSLQQWEQSVAQNLVAIDRSGLPLPFLLNSNTLPDLSVVTVQRLALSVFSAIERYYTINTLPGCVDPNSPNFSFQANVDDGSCNDTVAILSFGGVFQRCTALTQDGGTLCPGLDQKNPKTDSFSCQAFYNTTLLRSENKEQGYTVYECHRECKSCWLVFTCCKDICNNVYYVRRANVATYWCSAKGKVQESSVVLFGGLYSDTLKNPITKSFGCPRGFLSFALLSDGLKICLSSDYQVGTHYSMLFGGFFSCEAGNPLANGQQKCPPGFAQHSVSVSDGCQVMYCVRAGVFNDAELPPARLPPFTRPPLFGNDTVLGDRSAGRLSWRMGTQGDVQWVMVEPQSPHASAQRVGLGSVGRLAIAAVVFLSLFLTLTTV
nr:PREDICTED: macrophage-expressed gene 1 protein-like [Lepisosteus oculatus]